MLLGEIEWQLLNLFSHHWERKVNVSWKSEKNAQGYVLRYGIKKDKLYHSVMLYGQNDIALNCLNKGVDYFFAVEAFNENGVAELNEIIAGKSNSCGENN